MPAASVAKVMASATWSTAQLENLRGNIVVQSARQEAGSLGEIRTTGFVRNAGPVMTYFTHVHQDVRDAKDGVIDCDYAMVDGSPVPLENGEVTNTGMEPGQTAPYANDIYVHFTALGRIVTSTAWREVDTGPATPTSTLSWHSLVSRARAPSIADPRGRASLRRAGINELRRIIGDVQEPQGGSAAEVVERR